MRKIIMLFLMFSSFTVFCQSDGNPTHLDIIKSEDDTQIEPPSADGCYFRTKIGYNMKIRSDHSSPGCLDIFLMIHNGSSNQLGEPYVVEPIDFGNEGEWINGIFIYTSDHSGSFYVRADCPKSGGNVLYETFIVQYSIVYFDEFFNSYVLYDHDNHPFCNYFESDIFEEHSEGYGYSINICCFDNTDDLTFGKKSNNNLSGTNLTEDPIIILGNPVTNNLRFSLNRQSQEIQNIFILDDFNKRYEVTKNQDIINYEMSHFKSGFYTLFVVTKDKINKYRLFKS